MFCCDSCKQASFEKDTIVIFFSPTCSWCKAMRATIQEVAAWYDPTSAQFYGVNVRTADSSLQLFAKEDGMLSVSQSTPCTWS